MNKNEFLMALRKGLAGLPGEEREKNVAYYSELIDDMLEDGMSEAEAVEQLGSIQEIYENILSDTPLPLAEREQPQNRAQPHRGAPRCRLTPLIIILLVLGFPIWFSLAVAVLAVVLGIYIAVWAVVIALFAVIVGLVAAALGFALLFARLMVTSAASAVFALGVGLILLGLCVPAALLAVWAGKTVIRGTKALCRVIADRFRKEN